MSPVDPLFPVLFTTGLAVGLGHCIGMCGPVVVSLSMNLKGRNRSAPHILYHLGRLFTYAALGGAMGATGSFIQVAGRIASIQKGAMIFAGALIAAMGLAAAGLIPAGGLYRDSSGPSRLLSRGFRRLSTNRAAIACLPLGMLLGLLPCGPVYTALVTAARAGMDTGDPFQGMLRGMGLMVSFGLGTAPALLILAGLSGMGWLVKRTTIYRLGAILMVLVGIYYVVKGIRY